MCLEELQEKRLRSLTKLKTQSRIFDSAYRMYSKHRAKLNRIRQNYETLDLRCAELDGRLKILPALDSEKLQKHREREYSQRTLSLLSLEERKELFEELRGLKG